VFQLAQNRPAGQGVQFNSSGVPVYSQQPGQTPIYAQNAQGNVTSDTHFSIVPNRLVPICGNQRYIVATLRKILAVILFYHDHSIGLNFQHPRRPNGPPTERWRDGKFLVTLQLQREQRYCYLWHASLKGLSK
jgi:hypothetical protein